MKKVVKLAFVMLLAVGCSKQTNDTANNQQKETVSVTEVISEEPKPVEEPEKSTEVVQSKTEDNKEDIIHDFSDYYQKASKIISSDSSLAELYKHNPTPPDMNEIYIADFNKVKGKIYLVTDKTYWLNDAKIKIWDDFEQEVQHRSYYIFDSTGVLTAIYSATLYPNNDPFGSCTMEYSYDNDVFKMKYSESSIVDYTIKTQNDKFVVKNNRSSVTYEKYIETKGLSDSINSMELNFDDGSFSNTNSFSNRKETLIYKAGVPVRIEKIDSGGTVETRSVEEYDLSNNTCVYYYYRDDKLESQKEYFFDIKMDEDGMFTDFIKSPKGEDTPGIYTILTYEILDEPDEVLANLLNK